MRLHDAQISRSNRHCRRRCGACVRSAEVAICTACINSRRHCHRVGVRVRWSHTGTRRHIGAGNGGVGDGRGLPGCQVRQRRPGEGVAGACRCHRRIDSNRRSRRSLHAARASGVGPVGGQHIGGTQAGGNCAAGVGDNETPLSCLVDLNDGACWRDLRLSDCDTREHRCDRHSRRVPDIEPSTICDATGNAAVRGDGSTVVEDLVAGERSGCGKRHLVGQGRGRTGSQRTRHGPRDGVGRHVKNATVADGCDVDDQTGWHLVADSDVVCRRHSRARRVLDGQGVGANVCRTELWLVDGLRDRHVRLGDGHLRGGSHTFEIEDDVWCERY